jgi:hypothetical protein
LRRLEYAFVRTNPLCVFAICATKIGTSVRILQNPVIAIALTDLEARKRLAVVEIQKDISRQQRLLLRLPYPFFPFSEQPDGKYDGGVVTTRIVPLQQKPEVLGECLFGASPAKQTIVSHRDSHRLIVSGVV